MDATLVSEQGASPTMDETRSSKQFGVSKLVTGSFAPCSVFKMKEVKLASGMCDIAGMSARKLTSDHQ